MKLALYKIDCKMASKSEEMLKEALQDWLSSLKLQTKKR